MPFQAALNLRHQEIKIIDDGEQDGFVYVSGPAPRPHKFDKVTNFCVLCLTHRATYGGPICPGLLNPSIRFNVW